MVLHAVMYLQHDHPKEDQRQDKGYTTFKTDDRELMAL